jgi:hypothetical protein
MLFEQRFKIRKQILDVLSTILLNYFEWFLMKRTMRRQCKMNFKELNTELNIHISVIYIRYILCS